MPASIRKLVLQEWGRSDASMHQELQGLHLDDEEIASAARALRQGDLLRVEDRRDGLLIQARRHVGVVQLGPLQVIVQPRLPPKDLWYILAYGMGLEGMKRRSRVELLLPDAPFTDLLALALLEEAEQLWQHGLRRNYYRREEWLASPRGRIDMSRLAAAVPLAEAALPCSHHQLSTDIPENQMVRSGLWMASQMVYSPSVKTEIRRAERQWGEVCRRIPLDEPKLRRLEQGLTRLTETYAPVLRLVTLLHGGKGTADELDAVGSGDPVNLPGFLWNMATLFERFVAQFLQKHLRGADIRRQSKIETLYKVIQAPPRTRKPRPRPDILIERAGQVVAVLDTKYTDLQGGGLDSEILYQMSVYALAYGSETASGRIFPAIVLYPQVDSPRDDVVYALSDGRGGMKSHIIVRAIDWGDASRAMRDPARSAELPLIAEKWTRQHDARPLS